MKSNQTEMELGVKFRPPTFEMVKAEAKKYQLPEIEAEKFWTYFGSNGWKVGRVPMKDWKMALHHWRLKFTNVYNTRFDRPRAKTVFELKTIIEAKQKIADGLKRTHSSEVASGRQWDQSPGRLQYSKLMKEIKELTTQLAGM